MVQNTERLCQCGFNAEYITEYAFQCFPESDQQVTFRARLHETAHATSVQLIQDVEVWVNTGTSIAVQGVRINIDMCPVVISSFEDPQCLEEMSQPTTPSEMTTSDTTQTTPTMPPTSMETTSDSTTTETALLDTTDNTAAIVGGVVAVIIILAVTIIIIVIAILVTKNHKYKYPTQDLG